MSGDVRRGFVWSVRPSVGGESDGEGHCWTSDGGWTEVFTSFQNRLCWNCAAIEKNIKYFKIILSAWTFHHKQVYTTEILLSAQLRTCKTD